MTHAEMNHNSNLPISFDVTTLLSKLERLENKNVSLQVGNNVIQRVKLIELDPYHHTHGASQQTSDEATTRLFIAVAYGSAVVVAKLVALELGHVHNDDEAGEEVHDEELEWVDVSHDKVYPHNTEQGGDHGQIEVFGSSVVVFPPSLAETLPKCTIGHTSNEDIDESFLAGAEITSCALIPSPAITTAEGQRKTQRAVALMFGTTNDQVLSLPLSVSTASTNNNNDTDHVRFVLKYDECKSIENGELKEPGSNGTDGADDYAKYPCVHQILPFAKTFDAEGDDAKGEEEGNFSDIIDANLQVYHPSIRKSFKDREDMKDSKCSGIKSISYCRDNTRKYGVGLGEGDVTISHDTVWISYGNGTIVKLPSWRPFLSFGSGSGVSVDILVDGPNDVLGKGASVVPLNSPVQSPLDVPPATQTVTQPVSPRNLNKSSKESHENSYWALLATAANTEKYHQRDDAAQALVLAGQSAPASIPPIAFNTSRVNYDPASRVSKHAGGTITSSQFGSGQVSNPQEEMNNSRGMNDSTLDMSSDDEQYGLATGAVVEGTAALVKGALGVAFGAVRWGLGGGVNEQQQNDDDDMHLDEFMDVDDTIDDGSQQQPGSSQNGQRGGGKDLFPWPLSGAAFPFSDIPRKFETATVDPSGSLVATTDNLGRVILFDLETKQAIRMFKGMRNVSCYFAEVGRQLYLVIHLRQRAAVEIYRLHQGPRVTSLVVPQQKDCVVVECYGPQSQGTSLETFLLERIDESGERHYLIDKLVIDDTTTSVTPALSKQTPGRQASAQGDNRMQLKLLMQLLAPDTNIQCNAHTVLATFKSIRALADLGEGLDALSRCTRLESEMGVDGASVHSQAISYCKSRLTHAKETEAQEGSGMVRKDAISELSLKLGYHVRLNRAYDVLHRYESNTGLGGRSGEDTETTNVETLSPWASEALSWISAASENDAMKRFMSSYTDVRNDDKPLEFSKFAMTCQQSNDAHDQVYLTKIKRGRLPILKRVFRPLLQDLFVFKVVNSLFSHLGLDEDYSIQQQYFGEWCSTLSTHDIAESNLSNRTWRPMIRWLQDLIFNAYDLSLLDSQKSDDESLRKTAMLETMMKFCMEMEDLHKAYLLGVICMEAVSSATIQLEQKTYGKITQLESVGPWEELLRKLRVCLLVSLRLAGDVNPPGGNDPMTIRSVSRGGVFSTFSWIAKDELSLSHDNQVVIALETACLSSSETFYPSTADGDTAQHRKVVLLSCTNPHHASFLKNPTGLMKDTHSRPLIFYLKDHAHFTSHLAANRALILAGMWGETPDRVILLSNMMSALQTVADCPAVFSLASLATLVEIYQSRIRPVCRAMLFGFGEHELSEDVMSPLIENPVWIRDFISIAKQILSMIVECLSKAIPDFNKDTESTSEMWPQLRGCPVLNGLVAKHRGVQLSAVELHHTVLFAFEMLGSIDSLEAAVPSFSSLFLRGGLFTQMPPLPRGSIQQKALLDKAITDHAEKTTDLVDSFSRIKGIELFGRALGVDAKYVRTQYLVEMIRLGRDTSINDLLGGTSTLLDQSLFAESVVQIICGRLNATIASLNKTKQYRSILSLLDADASRWVKEEAGKSPTSQQVNYASASLITTYSMVMRLQSMTEKLDGPLSEKVNALSLMSGTLLKAVQAQEQDAVMNV